MPGAPAVRIKTAGVVPHQGRRIVVVRIADAEDDLGRVPPLVLLHTPGRRRRRWKCDLLRPRLLRSGMLLRRLLAARLAIAETIRQVQNRGGGA